MLRGKTRFLVSVASSYAPVLPGSLGENAFGAEGLLGRLIYAIVSRERHTSRHKVHLLAIHVPLNQADNLPLWNRVVGDDRIG
jgi:hypothetical protein